MRKILKKFTALMLTASLAAAPALQVMAAPEKDAPPDFIKNLNISDNPFEFYFSLENKNEYLDAMTLDEIKGFSNVLKYISLEYASSNHKILEDDISKTYSDFKKKFLNEKFEDSKSGFEMISEHAAKLNVQDFDTYKKYLTETSDLKITECLNVMTEIDQSETSEQVDENSMKLTALLKEKKDAAMNEELSDEKNQNEVQENNIKNENNKPQSEEIKNHSIEDNKEESSKKQKQNQKKNEITKENDSNKVKKTKEEKQPQKVSDEKKTKKKKNILLKKKKIVASEKKLYNEHNEIRKNLLKSQNLYAFDTGVSTKDLIKINMHDYDDSRANKKPALLPPQVLDLPINKNRPFTFQLYQEDHKVHSNEIGPDGEWHSPRWWNNYYLNPSYKEPMKFQKNIYAPQLINGYPALSDLCTGAEGFSLDYLFNNKISDGVINNYTDLDNLFVKDANGIYSMDSTTTNYQLNGKTFRHTPQNNESLVPFVPLSYESNQYPNFWFGMDITTNFFLPLNLTNNGKDIQYNFTGDDDLLVYIDDVLVLDLGGIHFPVSGSINFTKNTVTEEYAYTSVFDNGDLQNQRKGTLTHSIDDSFKKAGKTWDPIGAHTIKIFFLERGNGSSTCKMDFNFPLVPPPVNVIYEGNGGMWNGNTSSTDKAVIGENYTVKENFFNRDGYVFTGWNTRADGKGEDWTGKINKPFKWLIDHDVTLYAQWKLNKHTLIYDGNGGTKNGQTIHKDIVTMNQNYTVKENFFNRDGYVFTGWNTKADGKGEDWTGKINKPFKWNIDHDVTLYAQWKLNKHTLIYDGNGGTKNGQTIHKDIVTMNQNYTVKENFFNRDGYVFTGWNTKADGKGEDWTGKINKPFKWNIDHDVTLYAQWKLNEHTLTYNGNGGTKNGQTIHKDIVTMNQNYTVKENFFNRDGYVFTGWNTKADGKGEDWTGKINKPFKWNINHDVTLYAQWKAAKCTIVYEGNGGTWSGGTNVEDTVNYGSYYTIRNNLFTRNKASFKGWNTRADGKGEDWTSKIGQSIKWIHLEKLVLYAQWDLEPELTAPDKEYYEGEKVTKQDLLKGVVGSDYEDKDITKDVKIRKIEYAYGRLVNGKHQKPYDKVYTPDMPNDELLDTWFMELDKNPGYVIHKVTYEVKDSYGHITITKANVKVKYNNFPVITAEDRYFTLKEAQNGAITKDVLLKDEINKGRLWTDDIEEGKLNHRTDLVEFDPNEFTTLKHDAIIEVTFHAQDTMGPNGNGKETYKSINVHIENIIIPEKEDDDNGRHRRIRFINKKFYDRNDNSDLSAEESPNNGGLNTQSKWYKDPEYRNVIETSFAKTSGTDYVYMPEDIEEIRNFAEVHGVGNTKERGALQQFISQIMNK